MAIKTYIDDLEWFVRDMAFENDGKYTDAICKAEEVIEELKKVARKEGR